MLFTNLFLNGGFSTLGYDWYSHKSKSTSIYHDPLVRIFPRQAKCTYYETESSEKLEEIESLCLLPLNVHIAHIFLFLWVWYLQRYLYLFLDCCISSHRFDTKFYTVIVNFMTGKIMNLGYWFVLYTIARNIKSSDFVAVADELMQEHFNEDGTFKKSETIRNELGKQVEIEMNSI
ncbi:innexin shaking-B-like protein, partial [Leptotrombidium deliense]